MCILARPDPVVLQGRISQVSTQPESGTPAVILANQFGYYPFGAINNFTYGNDLGFWQGLNQDYRTGFNFDGVEFKAHAWHPDGSLKRRTSYGSATTATTYTYDATGRLTGAVNTAAASFGTLAWLYNPNGNRQSETRNAAVIPYIYSPPNWLYQAGGDYRIHNEVGNTAYASGLATGYSFFGYDGFNRLATSTTAAEVTTYTYNALGQRMKKRNQNGLSTVFHYGPNGELLYERDQAGNTKEYVWLDGRPLARIDNGTAIYYYHVDHLGTPQSMTDAAGAVKWKADYEPFGKATVKVSTVENNLRLPGQYYDRETGLHYNHFRDYDPTTGRYLEVDPIGLAGGINLYAYVGGNPISRVDPLGLAWDDPGNSSVYPPTNNCQCTIKCMADPKTEPYKVCKLIPGKTLVIMGVPVQVNPAKWVCEEVTKGWNCQQQCESECNQCQK